MYFIKLCLTLLFRRLFFCATFVIAFKQSNCVKYTNAMVTNHLRAPYGVYFTKNRTILRPAAGRIVRFFNILRHRTVPGEV